jgi:hypothetical protein
VANTTSSNPMVRKLAIWTQPREDRRRVIVEPVHSRLGEVEPLFEGMAAGRNAALADYDDTQLRVLLDLFGRMRTLAREQAAIIRAHPGST